MATRYHVRISSSGSSVLFDDIIEAQSQVHLDSSIDTIKKWISDRSGPVHLSTKVQPLIVNDQIFDPVLEKSIKIV